MKKNDFDVNKYQEWLESLPYGVHAQVFKDEWEKAVKMIRKDKKDE